jgi:anti-sigma B factor antagonist
VVTLRGELDITQAAELGRALAAAAIRGPRIIVDLAELTFIDCAGLSVLVAAQRTARGAGADLVLAAVQQSVARLLCLTNRVGVLPVFASVAEAGSGAPLTPAAVSPAPGRAGCEASSVNG